MYDRGTMYTVTAFTHLSPLQTGKRLHGYTHYLWTLCTAATTRLFFLLTFGYQSTGIPTPTWHRKTTSRLATLIRSDRVGDVLSTYFTASQNTQAMPSAQYTVLSSHMPKSRIHVFLVISWVMKPRMTSKLIKDVFSDLSTPS